MAADRAPDSRGDKGGDPILEIEKYSLALAQDPKSRVFALLAEAYRKAGRLDEAVKAAVEGLRHHPHYMGGRTALARAYYDQGMKEAARVEFEKVVSAAPDNLMAHRHLADIYAEEGRLTDAAKSLKMILLLDPRDARAKEKLDEIAPPSPPQAARPSPGGEAWGAELDLLGQEEPSPPVVEFEPAAAPAPTAAEAVLTAAAPAPPPAEAVPAEAVPTAAELLADLSPPAPAVEPAPPPREQAAAPAPPTEPEEEEYFTFEDLNAPSGEAARAAAPEEPPRDELSTETLADIYVQQGFHEKALEIYNKILEQRPDDQRLRKKCEELRGLAFPGVQQAGAAPPAGAPAPQPPDRDDAALAALRSWLERIQAEKR